MAGFEAQESIAALPGVLNLATAGNIDLARAADIASNALTAMQLPVEELGRVNDVFIATITRSNTDMEMMAESFKYSAAQANAYGYSIEQLSAMIGILGSAGIQGCYDDQTDVLTKEGWKNWKNVTVNDEFATVNPETHKIEYQKPIQLIRYNHIGKMYLVKNQNIDLCVTPDHRMLVKKHDKDNSEIIRASDIKNKNVEYLTLNNDKLIPYEVKTTDIEWIDYNGEVFCAEVPNHLLIVSRNGRVVVSGNSMAGTQLAFAMGQVEKVFKKLGMSGEGKKLIDALEAVNTANWSVNETMSVFGARGGRAVLVLKNLIPEYRELEKANRNAAGSAEKLAKIMEQTVSGAFKGFQSAIESIKIEVFEGYQGRLLKGLQNVTTAIRGNKNEIVSLIDSVIFGGLRGIATAVAVVSDSFDIWTLGFKRASRLWLEYVEKPILDGIILMKKAFRVVAELFPGTDRAKEYTEEINSLSEASLLTAQKIGNLKLEVLDLQTGFSVDKVDEFFEAIKKGAQESSVSVDIQKGQEEAASTKEDQKIAGEKSKNSC